MPLLETKAAASAQGFGLTLVGAERVFIEDVFSTFLYTGNGSTQTITNGIDLLGEGGLVWCKPRSVSGSHSLTYRPAGYSGSGSWLKTDSSDGSPGNINRSYSATGFSTSGVSVDSNNGDTFASWTLRNQPKFFTAVEYTGNGSNRTIAHNLGSVPGCIIVKRLDFTPASDWQVYHRSNANTEYMVLNSTAAKATGATRWNSTTPTSTVFSLGTDTTVNANGGTYVAYLFAHDAGGFGLNGTDNVISCGSFTNSSGLDTVVNIGWEPQWVLVKNISFENSFTNWGIFDSMRGMTVSTDLPLVANTSESEAQVDDAQNGSMDYITPTATGFIVGNAASRRTLVGGSTATCIYIAIRRGPMRVPTSGTSVFAPSARSGTGAAGSSTALGNVTDLAIIKQRGSTQTWAWTDRLRGATNELTSAAATAETAYSNDVTGFDSMTGFLFGSGASGQVNSSGSAYIDYLLRRAPGFFDVVCYTGNGTTNQTIAHNLNAVPELIITKGRNGAVGWYTYQANRGVDDIGDLSSTSSFSNQGSTTVSKIWGTSIPTSTNFYLGRSFSYSANSSGDTYVAYLFATVAGVSKVGSYTGTGSTLQINCGFTGGARFVLIKRTDSTGNWLVWDSARGIVAGNDPYLALNSTAAEVTTTDWVDTFSSGFELSNVGGNNVNINTATYIYLAIV